MNLLKKIGIVLGAILFLLLFSLLFLSRCHVDLSAYDEYLAEPSSLNDSSLYVQFAGISTLLISDGETQILTDGFFSRPSMSRILLGEIYPDTLDIAWALDKLEASKLDGIFVLHSHFDHSMDAPEVARITGANLYGSASTANVGRGWGLPENQIKVFESGESLQIGKFRIQPILTQHYEFPNALLKERALEGSQNIDLPLVPPAKAFDYKMGGAYSLYIEHPQSNFLIHGSAGYIKDGFSKIRPDIVFLGIGGLGKQKESYQVQYFEELLDKTEVKKVFPIHFDAFAGSIRKSLQGPTYLNNIMMDTEGSLQATLDACRSRSLEAELLPQWEKVKLSD
ncbi:MAG: MBL fold metallo-hydrolase [Bacteroidia bacterium]|nr:MBL fold metallo-hydrolase [Bacteroidia bacterium]